MSEAETSDTETPQLRAAYRTVTRELHPHPDAEMNAIGWSIFAGILVLLMPLLPVLVLVWLVTRALDALAAEG